jgi:hypothetical protein
VAEVDCARAETAETITSNTVKSCAMVAAILA